MITAKDLRFSASDHVYTLSDGRVVPSVTTVLRAVGVSVDFEALREQSVRTREAIDLKRDLGTALHMDAHALDDHDLDWATVDLRVEPYLRAWATFRENTGLIPVTRERRVFHGWLFYCGTLDGIFATPNGKHVLCDIKCGDPSSAAGHLQTAAYEAAYQLEHALRIDERWAVQLCPDKAIPYRIFNYSKRPDAWQDFARFQACLTVFNEQPDRRERKFA
jgi:hypothetical protein